MTLYIGKDCDGNEVKGHEFRVDLTGAWIKEKNPYGSTDTRVDPYDVQEIEE